MTGATALKYGRSRHSSSDFARGMRHISIILAVADKLFQLEALDNVKDFYTSLTKAVKTDISLDQITTIVPILKTVPNTTVVQIGLDNQNVLKNSTANNGAFILISKEGEDNWDAVHTYIKEKI